MVTATPEKSISIENCGPIGRLDIPIIPGVTVLRGLNGSGKSQALRAIERLGGNDKLKLPIKDGAKKGAVEGCGVHIVFSGRVSTHGDLEVQSLHGRFDIAKLVDPGIKDVASADAERIKAVLNLLDIPVDASTWHDTAGGPEEFNALGIELTGDLVTDAGKVKRALEDKARKLEAEAIRLSGLYAARTADANEYGPEVDRDAAKLNAAVEAAIALKSKIDEQRKNFEAQSWRRQEAKRQLDALPASREAELLAKANELAAVRDEKSAAVEAIEEKIVALKAELATAISLRSHAIVEHDAAVSAWQSEHDRSNDRVAFEATLATELPPGPTDGDIAEAAQSLEAARQAAELGSLARKADEKAAEARELKKQETELRTKADSLREAAKSTSEVLSDMVAKLDVGLVVYEGRLSVQTDRGTEPEPFSELSQGERSRIATELCCLRVGRGGLLPVAQEYWEGLDPINKRAIAAVAEKHGVYVVTAEADAGELRAESFNGTETKEVEASIG